MNNKKNDLIHRSPMTACVLVLEMTKEMNLAIPLLITAGAAALTSNFIAEKRNK
jgi:H+/Cl- antiporter ClcA